MLLKRWHQGITRQARPQRSSEMFEVSGAVWGGLLEMVSLALFLAEARVNLITVFGSTVRYGGFFFKILEIISFSSASSALEVFLDLSPVSTSASVSFRDTVRSAGLRAMAGPGDSETPGL